MSFLKNIFGNKDIDIISTFSSFWGNVKNDKNTSQSLQILGSKEARTPYIVFSRAADLDYLYNIMTILKRHRGDQSDLTALELIDFIKSCDEDFKNEVGEESENKERVDMF